MSKKNQKGGKGKGGGGSANEEILTAERVNKNDGKVKALQQILINEQERADKCKASENEIKARVFECELDLKKEKEKTYSIVADMTRMYKQTQEQLQQQINQLKQQEQEKIEIINQKNQEIAKLKDEQHLALKTQDDNIENLKKRITEMSADFARMLKETLERMQQRIECAPWDQESNVDTVNKIKNIIGYNNS